MHKNYKLSLKSSLPFLLFIIIIFYSGYSFSDIRQKPFSSTDRSRINIYIGGNYKSDYNSKDYIINFGAKHKNKNFMNEIKFYNKATEAHTTTKPMRKTKESYELELSNKIKIADSQNYLNIYNLFEQDKYKNFNSSDKLVYGSSGFYNRITSAAGIGRVFSVNFEADINIGWIHSEGEGGSVAINPVLYLNKKINKTLKLSSRISTIKKEKTQNDYFSFSITQKISKNLALSLYHKYNRKEYIYRKKNSKVDIRETKKLSERSLTLNLKYYL